MRYIIIIFLLISKIIIAQEYLPISINPVIRHEYYTIGYSEKHEQANWVYYSLMPSMLEGKEARTNDFRSDPSILTGSSQLEDYIGSGYDRGHLAPAGDMKLNHTSMSESFYLSNMSPQEATFNRGIWKSLETRVRRWGWGGKIYIVSGGIMEENLPLLAITG